MKHSSLPDIYFLPCFFFHRSVAVVRRCNIKKTSMKLPRNDKLVFFFRSPLFLVLLYDCHHFGMMLACFNHVTAMMLSNWLRPERALHKLSWSTESKCYTLQFKMAVRSFNIIYLFNLETRIKERNIKLFKVVF